jgi:hypothetical protein
MSIEGTSKIHPHSPTSCERRKKKFRLWYQQNKDKIHECKRALYHIRTTQNMIPNDFPNSCKYRSLVDIMRRTFPLDVSFQQSFQSQDISNIPQSPDNIVLFRETSHIWEDHHVENQATNDNLQCSSNENPTLLHAKRVQNLHGEVTDDI